MSASIEIPSVLAYFRVFIIQVMHLHYSCTLHQLRHLIAALGPLWESSNLVRSTSTNVHSLKGIHESRRSMEAMQLIHTYEIMQISHKEADKMRIFYIVNLPGIVIRRIARSDHGLYSRNARIMAVKTLGKSVNVIR